MHNPMKSISVNDISIACHDSGRGVPLLLVHGFPFDHSMWNGQIDALSERYRVIAPDLRGFGQSELGEGVVTMEQMADDLAALLDALEIGEPVVLCGLSMGGYIAFEFWRKYAARLKALILCDTRAAADKPEVAANRLAMADRVLREGPQPLVDSMLPKLFSPQTYAERPHLVDEIERIMLRTDPRGIAAAARAHGPAARLHRRTEKHPLSDAGARRRGRRSFSARRNASSGRRDSERRISNDSRRRPSLPARTAGRGECGNRGVLRSRRLVLTLRRGLQFPTPASKVTCIFSCFLTLPVILRE